MSFYFFDGNGFDFVQFEAATSTATIKPKKIDIINKAYSMGKISGLTVQPSKEDISLALDRLESMAAEWADNSICVGYNFEENPDPNSVHNIPRKYWTAFESGLMVRLLPDFGKEPTPALILLASSSFSRLSSSTAVVPRTSYPSTHPRGSGNLRYNRFNKYFTPVDTTPIECDTFKMTIGDINDFYEDYSAYLGSGETIASHVIEAETGITVSAEVLTSPRIFFRVEAVGPTAGVYQLKITATTSSGRVDVKVRNFELCKVEIN